MKNYLLVLLVLSPKFATRPGVKVASAESDSPATDAPLGWTDGTSWWLGPYKTAVHLAVDAMHQNKVQRATAYVCWGNVELSFIRALAAVGVTVQILRGPIATRSNAVEKYLSMDNYRSAIIVDMMCPASERFLHLASRMKLFDVSNLWLVFQDARFTNDTSSSHLNRTLIEVIDFPDLEIVPDHLRSALDREEAIVSNETIFLDIPSPPPNPRPGVQSDPSLLSSYGSELWQKLKVFQDSDVIWIQTGQDENDTIDALCVFRSSMVRPVQVYRVAVASPGDTRWTWKLDKDLQKTLQLARNDLEGGTLRALTIILKWEHFTHIEDISTRQWDLYPKIHYPVMQNLAATLNFSIVSWVRGNFGWHIGGGKFDGAMSEFQQHLFDIMATGVFVRTDRQGIIDITAPTFVLRTSTLFRQPTKSSVSNIFLLPFSTSVWFSMLAASMLTILVLTVQMGWWTLHPEYTHGNDEIISLGDCVTFILGAFCQQGFPQTPSHVSARATILTAFVTSLFLFTSFSAAIVAILQSPSNTLRSISDLTSSKLDYKIQDIAFHHAWLKEISDPLTEELYKRKVKPQGEKVFTTVSGGIKRMRRGQIALQVESNEGYQEISKTFTEDEKCDLGEMHLFPQHTLNVGVIKRSPYKEAIAKVVRWQREVGILNRIHRQWESSRPACPFNLKGFVAVGIQECYPAVLVLYYGVLLSIAALLGERAYAARGLATCIMRGCVQSKTLSAVISRSDKKKKKSKAKLKRELLAEVEGGKRFNISVVA